MHGRRLALGTTTLRSPPSNVCTAYCRPVVGQCVERPQHFNRPAVQNYNVDVPFSSGACSSIGCLSVASPPRGRPWRLSPWRVLKNRLKKEGNETVTICNAFKLSAKDGKMRLTPITDQEQLFRLIQSIPSPRQNHLRFG